MRCASGREANVRATNLSLVAAAGSLPTGSIVVLRGLTKTFELNGIQGTIWKEPHPDGRLMVDLRNGPAKALKYDNLILVKGMEQSTSEAIGQSTVRDRDGEARLKAGTPGSKVTITGSIIPGVNGTVVIVLCIDSNDSERLVTLSPADGKLRAFPRKQLSYAGSEASASELEQFQAPFKEALCNEVRKCLWGYPGDKMRSMHLSSPPEGEGKINPFQPERKVLAAWTALRGVAPKAQSVSMHQWLKERDDIFVYSRDPAGYETIGLTDVGRDLNRFEGIPEPPTKKRRVENDSGRQIRDEMARAMYTALKLCASSKTDAVNISQLGSDVQVQQLRKDPRLKKVKLVDLLCEYPNIFELVDNGGWHVRLMEDAELALPQRVAGDVAPAGGGDVLPDSSQSQLPDKIENPTNPGERLQALRIELIHSLHRRNGRANPSELGAEGGVQRARKALTTGKKGQSLLVWVSAFPDNFSMNWNPHFGYHEISLESMSVEDMKPVHDWLAGRRPPKAFVPGPMGFDVDPNCVAESCEGFEQDDAPDQVVWEAWGANGVAPEEQGL